MCIRDRAITYTNYGDLLKDSNKKIEYYLKSKALWDKYQPNSLLSISNNISIANFYREIAEDEKLQKENNLSRAEALNKAEKLLLEQVNNCKKIKHRGKNCLLYTSRCV